MHSRKGNADKSRCLILCPHCNNPLYIAVDVVAGDTYELMLDPDEIDFMQDEECFMMEPKHNMCICAYTLISDIHVSCEHCNATWSIKPLQKTFTSYEDMIDYIAEAVRDTLREQ